MKKVLLSAVISSLVLMSCENGIMYTSCVVTTSDSFVNTFYPDGICRDVDGGGFVLKSDAVSWCKEKVPVDSLEFVGVTENELIYEPQRQSCTSVEE
ncbi:MAG: hypothetical protein HRU38_13810 [Saccharospirillaceae bacterium]|nr:hypothetical protein [Pseudomonadales bacterium]NRB79721.1 hypothetical protein [Saccharospirillaceae bacterium]